MKFRKALLCGVAAGALGLAAAMPDATVPSFVQPAEAQVRASVSIGFGTFYDRLSPHGDWVSYEGRYVWVPTSVDDQWRPYTVGRWVYTRPYGWMWVSDEPFSWAVYHYGRWGFHHNIGWYWVPDTQWAPAWVTWRTSGDYVAWAPMPPSGAVQVSFEIDPLVVPARYWVAVPTQRFLAPNIFSVALHPWEPQFYDVVRYTRPAGHVTIVENQTINNIINVNYIEEVTGEEVNIRQVNFVEQETATDVQGDAVALYAPSVEEEPDAQPQEVRSLEEVSERRQAAAAPDAPEEIQDQIDQPVEVAEDAPDVSDEVTAGQTPPEDTPGADVVEDTPAAEDEGDVAEEETTPPEGTPGADVVEETPAEGEEPAADVAEEAPSEEAPGADVVEETPAEEAPGAGVAEQAQPQVEEPSDVGERAIGEPASPGQAAGEGGPPEQAPGQQRQQEEED